MMSISQIVVYGMLILSIFAPFIALYAVKLVKQGKYEQHIKVQKNLFYACVTGVILLELTIRFSGGSGSLVKVSPYLATTFFHTTLWAHIIGAVLTYIVWAFTIFKSKNQNKKKQLPGRFSTSHRKLGYVVIIGLFYTGITALMVCSMAFFL
ncbi:MULTISPECIES: DUF420 domain-containing protein [unclassified Empedobacter]|uniref:DUF420 domain-containing protein n=1 Tax=unclassified Empedobacter TaxID=2643773 RepID=UPI0025BA1698|nr:MULTISPECIES: DUF420 domain-containing protein [unclassified Empedobacter]